MAASGDSLRDALTRDVFEWTAQDVSAWVSQIGLVSCASSFTANCITGMDLSELDNDDLRSLGLMKVGERKVFLRALRHLCEKEENQHPTDSSHSSASADTDSWDIHSDDSEGSQRSAGSKRASQKKFTSHVVKAYYRDRTKVFDIAKDSSISELRSQVRSLFHKRMVIHWKDLNGEKVTLKQDRDWTRCKRENGERIRLWCIPASSGEAAAKQSEFRALGQLSDPVIVIDATGKIVMFNPAAEGFFGYKSGMMIGSKVNLLMPDDEAVHHDGYLSHYIETGEKRVIGKGRRVLAQKRSGEKTPVYLTVTETSSRRRTERQFIGTLQDMSHGQTEDSIIKEDQSSAYAILQNILDAAVVIDQKGVVKFFNTAAEDLFGHKPSAVVGKNVNVLMQGKDKREHDNYLSTYLKTGQSTVIGKGRTVVAALADGSLKSVHLAVSEQKLGINTLFTGVVRPTEEKQVEEGSRQMTIVEQIRDILENLLVAAALTDDQGKILAFNESAEELFGYKLVNVIGKNVKMLCPPEHSINHDQYLARWRETGEEHVFGIGRDLAVRTAAGAIVPIRLSVTKRKDESGRFLLTGTFQHH